MPVITTTTIDYKITNIDIDTINMSIQVTIARGMTENGTFTAFNTFTTDINQADTQTLMNAMPATDVSIYNTIKTALYTQLITNNVIAGTVA